MSNHYKALLAYRNDLRYSLKNNKAESWGYTDREVADLERELSDVEKEIRDIEDSRMTPEKIRQEIGRVFSGSFSVDETHWTHLRAGDQPYVVVKFNVFLCIAGQGNSDGKSFSGATPAELLDKVKNWLADNQI